MKSSPDQHRTFTFGSFVYQYELQRSNRKTLSLTVLPDLSILVRSPIRANDERIETFLRKKWFWLEKQLSFFRKYQRKMYKKEYLSGEGFLYLGKQYKLLVKRAKIDRVSLTKGLLLVETTREIGDGRYTKKLVAAWYAGRITQVFTDRYETMLVRFNLPVVPQLAVKSMEKRWGSFVRGSTVVLNPQLIHTPKECIDYVIVHELCHSSHKNHDKNFHALLKKKYPKWQKAKEKLEMIGLQSV